MFYTYKSVATIIIACPNKIITDFQEISHVKRDHAVFPITGKQRKCTAVTMSVPYNIEVVHVVSYLYYLLSI